MRTLAFILQWLICLAASMPIAIFILWLLGAIKSDVFIR